jgi:hypothetical protein
MYLFSGNCAASVHIHVSVSDLYIPRIGPHISLQKNRLLEIYKSLTDTVHECRNWETEHYNSVLEMTVSFMGIHINGNQTFILDSHWPFICSASQPLLGNSDIYIPFRKPGTDCAGTKRTYRPYLTDQSSCHILLHHGRPQNILGFI